MASNSVAIAAIVTTGVFLSVVAWQLLWIARTAVGRNGRSQSDLHQRLEALEALHPTDTTADHDATGQ